MKFAPAQAQAAAPPPARFPGAAAPAAQTLARARVDRDTTPVTLPSPDKLGVARRAAEVDWTATHRRMHELGVLRFRMGTLTSGEFVFICDLPGAKADETFSVWGQGATQTEAVRLALEKAAPYKRARG